jgi:hypothetical protein
MRSKITTLLAGFFAVLFLAAAAHITMTGLSGTMLHRT